MIEGSEALKRKLAAIPTRLTDAVRVELERQAEDLVGLMRRLAPADTGALRASIGWTWGDAPAGSMVIGTVQAPGGGREFASMRITIFAGGKTAAQDAFYARFQEFGTKNMPANPFFFPAYRSRKRQIRSSLTRAMRKALKDA